MAGRHRRVRCAASTRYAPYLDRKPGEALADREERSSIIGAWELLHAPDVPYRVVINEAVELAKTYGGTDGHKFVNGVLDKLAPRLRAPRSARTRAAS